ncbi:hypothetical protein [Microbacterium paraoxydans]|uniref:DUF3618 domain-containing protein n=1 Tax=Microbacterium paraoxydans TaxID=199592 RepID=A0ABS5IJK9_9MICO|nr:hypothetical protein [Microbacterium paraoxydans]MBS0022911.1 hypothetical protein [Microbacterium paraoxydans]
MSQNNAGGVPGGGAGESPGVVKTAAHEAEGVMDTAKEEAAGVIETAKAEAGAVAHEATDQVRELYRQTTAELSEQAAVQQRRVADGLRSVSGELGSMAENAQGGVAADLVRQASTRLQGIAGWIGDRDPGSVLTEVKSYARAKPGTFIAVAALAGLVVGRLTRALSEGAAESSRSNGSAATGTDATAAAVPPAPVTHTDPAATTPGAVQGGTAAAAGGSTTLGEPPLPTDGTVPGAPDGLSGIDAGTAPWGVTRDEDRADTPLYDRTDAATRGSTPEERP